MKQIKEEVVDVFVRKEMRDAEGVAGIVGDIAQVLVKVVDALEVLSSGARLIGDGHLLDAAGLEHSRR